MRLLADRGLRARRRLAERRCPESVQALIAARLDTLSPERKSLLQDAAVLGKVFWAGALAEMGGREPSEVELALHELARKELVRPARTSSMEGESEYGFWHLLVRDVCLRPDPARRAGRPPPRRRRLDRAARRASGSRTWPTCSPTTTCRRSSSPRPPATRSRPRSSPRRRDATSRSPASGRSASTPPRPRRGSPGRSSSPRPRIPSGPSCSCAGRTPPPRPAARARRRRRSTRRSPRSAPAARPRPTAGRCQLRSRVALRLGEGRQVALAAEAVALLEPEPPGPELVAAYAQLANAQSSPAPTPRRSRPPSGPGARREARPARAGARARLPRLRPRLPRRCGRPRRDGAGARPARRAGGGPRRRDPAEQPRDRPLPAPGAGPLARRLRAGDRLLRAARPRRAGGAASRANCPGLLVELGRPEEALERAGRLAAAAEASGDTHRLIEVRAVELASRLARGEHEAAPPAPTGSSRQHGQAAPPMWSCSGSRPPPPPRSPEAPEQARALLAELEQAAGARETPYYAETARRDGANRARRRRPRARQAARRRARAPLPAPRARPLRRPRPARRARRRPRRAATLYAEAAARWQEFGNVPERAYALLGQGRCLLALGQPRPRSRSPRHATCSRRWATSRRSPRPRRCSSGRPRLTS